MRTSKSKIIGFIVPFTGVLLFIAVTAAVHSRAQPVASNTKQTNGMTPFIEAWEKAIYSGTEATNLTEIERSHLINESIKTNLAAQLWFRMKMAGGMSQRGATMAEEIRVLESLRKEQTEDAIRRLENDRDGDIILMAQDLRASDTTKAFQPTPQPVEALKMAKEYRLKFPHKSGDSTMDERVKNELSYLDRR